MQDVRYLDTGPLGNMYASSAVIDSNDVEAQAKGLPLTMGALYEASLMQDSLTKRGPVDNWGNVKIPRVDQLDPSLADADGWIEVGNTTSVEAYYSLLGLPFVNLPGADGIVEFNVESVYVALSAASHRSFGPPYINGEGLMFTGVNITCPNCISRILNRGSAQNITIESARSQMLWGPPYPQMNESMLANANVSGTRYIRFDSGTKGLDPGTSPGTSTVFCDVTQHFVEARIRCEFGSCRSIGVRKSTTDHRDPKITTFDYWGPYALDMISVRSRADGSSVSSPSELFINDSSSNPIKPGFQTPSLSTVNLSRADPQVFADSATILLNTAIQIFMAPSGFTGGLPTSNLSIYGIPHIPADGPTLAFEAMQPKPTSLPLPEELIAASLRNMAPFVAASTTAKVTLFEEVYKPDHAWVAALILSSAILVLTGFAGLFLGSQVQAPDVFDPLVALTYNNPHINRSAEASTLGGNERARLLSDVTVRLGDVKPYGEVGRISLGQTAAVQPLHSGRLYE
jgi:hypothetical protein